MISRSALYAELESAIAVGSQQRRASILSRVTDLFVQGSTGFSEDEVALFDNVITRLAEHIELAVRVRLAHRLAPVANAPINIMRTLATDNEIEVAAPVLIQSERLDTAALVAIARTKSQEHLLAISHRRTLSEDVTDILVARGDGEVLRTATSNLGAKFSESAFSILVTRSGDDDSLAALVGARTDIPPKLFDTLLEKASKLVRDKLTAERPDMAEEINHAVASVAFELRSGNVKAIDYSEAQILVGSLSDGRLGDDQVRKFAENGEFEPAVAALAHLCGVPLDIVERALLDSQAETLVVLCRAAGLSWVTTKAVLAFHARSQHGPIRDIDRNIASFERLSVATARKIVEFYRTRGTASKRNQSPKAKDKPGLKGTKAN